MMWSLLKVLAGGALCVGAAATTGWAQKMQLPDAPQPAVCRAGLVPDAALQNSAPTPVATAQEPPPPDPQLTMFRHSQTSPYWISGQANTIFQGKPGFHSPYQGPNSLDNAAEYKTSIVETLYLGYEPHRHLRYNTDLLVDVESAGGRGLGEALGLSGFKDLDVVRNPNLGSAPYLARGEIHQTIGLTNEMVEVDRDQFNLATQAPARRFEIRVGKMGAYYTLDHNLVARDSHSQFMNWTVDDN